MAVTAKIPATIITGFLGAGKTSLIRHLMQQAEGRRIALLINEFGDVGVDGAILKACGNADCPEEAIIELPNGCICCTVADDFLPAIERLLALPGRFDHIVIETSGLALPKPLVKAFDWPAIRSRLTVDGVIAVVDGPAVADGRFAEDATTLLQQRAEIGLIDHDNPVAEVYEDQLLCADMVILNKTDLMDTAGRERVRGSIRAELTRQAVPIIEASHGAVAPAVLLGLGAAAEDDLANRPSHHDAEAEHDHEDFETMVLDLPALADPLALLRALGDLAERHGVLRAKGYLRVAGKPMRYLAQAVGPRVSGHFEGAAQGNEGRLVLIGLKGFDQAAIRVHIEGATLAPVG